MKAGIISLLLSTIFPISLLASNNAIDEQINQWFQPVTDFFVSIIFIAFRFGSGEQTVDLPFILIWLLGGALFATLYFRFINIRAFSLALGVVRGKYEDHTSASVAGEVTHFQALTAALSGTVGLGNIAGTALAISIGGPGATFWMILAGLLGMSTKFLECTLGVRYRIIDPSGKVFGGPFYYLTRGFQGLKMDIGGEEQHFGKIGNVLASIFALACIGGSFGGGNMFQINQAFDQFNNIPAIQNTWIAENGWCFGLIVSVLVFMVIIGGVKSIVRVTEKVVPFMCGIYVLAALFILVAHLPALPAAFGAIFKGVLGTEAISGGFVGVLIQGIRRGTFSNEAGVGSASIAHAAVRTNYPASEGIVALLEPFIDTVVVCTMTALVIIVTGTYTQFTGDTSDAAGIALTSAAFASTISWFPYVLTVAVMLFAFSTMITWSYYGTQAVAFLFGPSKTVEITYKVLFCLAIVVGAASTLKAVTDFSDTMIFAMSFPNIIGLIVLAPVAKKELERYLEMIKQRR